MDLEITNQFATVENPENKNLKTSLFYQMEMELLVNQNTRLLDQRTKLLDMVERLQVEKQKPQPETKIEMMQTPAGHIQVGDVIGYDRSNKCIRFGTVTRLSKDGSVYLTHSYAVVFGDDNKQTIYQLIDGYINSYRVCQIL